MAENFINEYVDDETHGQKIESDLNDAITEQKELKRLVDLFMLALVLIFALYSIF